MNKRNNSFTNKTFWLWFLIVSALLAVGSSGGVALFKANAAYECSQNNENRVVELEKTDGVVLERLEYISKGIDDIQEEQKEIKRDIKRLRR